MSKDEQTKMLFKSMTPRKGFMRTVNKCNDCGQLFGRQFIPYSMGHGRPCRRQAGGCHLR